MLTLFFIFSSIACIAVSFWITFKLGKMQNPSQNEKYKKNRGKTFLLLSAIYGFTLLLAVCLVYLLFL
ncbi:hypothetical protein SAMN05444955_102274 [Lihuaxuella thermophila]|uniref:Uncharacterized protein n=1 Tax=Lihuaxuella thermophila TaxID=1173111 RepID=A0A1H8BN67_9BACL|nr:hypothetical protein SAMN05444955_102274 [Lihuaxuella thermophila]